MVAIRKSTRRLGRSTGSGSSGSRSKAPRRSMSPISEDSDPIVPIRSVPDIDAVDSQHSPYFLHSADHPGLLVAGSVFAFVMDLCSSFPGFSDFTSSSKEIVVDDNLFGEHPWLKLMIKPLFPYGSLSRPPDLHSTMVCTCFRTLLSQFPDFGARNDVNDVVFWSYLASRYAHREGELMLDSFKQILEYEINIGWLELLLEHPVLMFRTYVQLVSRECNILDQNDSQRQFGTTVVPVACQVGYVGHHPGVVNAAVYSNVAAGSLNIVVPATFQVGDVGHHPCVVNVAVSSNSDSSLNTYIYDKDGCVFAGKRFCFKQRMFGCLKCSQQVIHCFRTKISHGALCATHDLLLKQCLPLVFMHSQNRDYGSTEHMLSRLPGRFGTLIEILFGSLPRPPEIHCDFSSSSLSSCGILQVQDERYFHLEGEY